ncbi:uncharacterized protein LOC123306955 [Coccinella septempunctata]|uniref:uncharacterized protein LOC123306955 n=1 Tax=Coccinella septempunctata TaxID=41139 RepID=UPI001D081301|nr:uncharacterized protein LOC123306955 [Coccinella septempunctata]
MSRRKLSQKEIERLAESLSEIDSGSEPENFESSSDEYEPGSDDDDSTQDESPQVPENVPNTATIEEERTNETDFEEEHENQVSTNFIIWSDPDESFEPLRSISHKRPCTISSDITADFTPIQIFMKLVPRSLFAQIAHCTNERMKIYAEAISKRTRIEETNLGEIQVVIGCSFIMSYNKSKRTETKPENKTSNETKKRHGRQDHTGI